LLAYLGPVLAKFRDWNGGDVLDFAKESGCSSDSNPIAKMHIGWQRQEFCQLAKIPGPLGRKMTKITKIVET